MSAYIRADEVKVGDTVSTSPGASVMRVDAITEPGGWLPAAFARITFEQRDLFGRDERRWSGHPSCEVELIDRPAPSELASPRADVLAEQCERGEPKTSPYRDALGAYLGDEPGWRLVPTEPPADIGPDAEDEYRQEKRT